MEVIFSKKMIGLEALKGLCIYSALVVIRFEIGLQGFTNW